MNQGGTTRVFHPNRPFGGHDPSLMTTTSSIGKVKKEDEQVDIELKIKLESSKIQLEQLENN